MISRRLSEGKSKGDSKGKGKGKDSKGKGFSKGKGKGKDSKGKGKGKGKGGNKGGAKVIVEPHRHEGIFIARGKEDVLCTLNMVPGEAVYGEKRIAVEVNIQSILLPAALSLLGRPFATVPSHAGLSDRNSLLASEPGSCRALQEDGVKKEYRVWNPFRSKIAAAIVGGVDNIWIKPGAKVR